MTYNVRGDFELVGLNQGVKTYESLVDLKKDTNKPIDVVWCKERRIFVILNSQAKGD